MVGLGWEIVGNVGVNSDRLDFPFPPPNFGMNREFLLYLHYWDEYTEGAYLPSFLRFFHPTVFAQENGLYILKKGKDLTPEELAKSWKYANELLYPYAKVRPSWEKFCKLTFAKLILKLPISEVLDYIKRWRDIVYKKLELVGHTDDGRPIYRLWSRRLVKLYRIDPRLIDARKCVFDYWNKKWLP